MLEAQDYYHGILPRDQVHELLKNDGDFLIRESQKSGETLITCSVRWQTGEDMTNTTQQQEIQEIKHFIINYDSTEGYAFENEYFPTVTSLIEHYIKTGHQVTWASTAILKKSIPRQFWEFKQSQITCKQFIGEGFFGKVYEGTLQRSDNVFEKVAVKMCDIKIKEDGRRKFLNEACMMRKYKHENVVLMHGVCAEKETILIILELLAGGPLETYIQRNEDTLKLIDQLKYCLHAARGMAYLEIQKCIHRDLAARNCLLNEDNSILKISDFGISREAIIYKVESAKHVPIRWSAPESLLEGTFSSKSDVWSFGILIWEIFNGAKLPYDQYSSNKEIAAAIKRLELLVIPSNCPKELNDVVKRCWQKQPQARPNFARIRDDINEIYQSYLNKI